MHSFIFEEFIMASKFVHDVDDTSSFPLLLLTASSYSAISTTNIKK
jgi:hypothetical protein